MAAALLFASGCVARVPDAGLAAAAPRFEPQAFFSGTTEGVGTLHVVLSRPQQVRVAGDGHVDARGTLVLVQHVVEGNKPARTRTWRLPFSHTGDFSGTLSDAAGRISADVQGNRLHLRFRAKGGLAIEQWLYLQPGGQVALNRMIVRKFGIRVAALDETIRRVP